MAKTITTANAIATGLTAQHIATNLANYEAARSPFFVFEVSDLDNLLNTNYQGGINDDDAAANMMDGTKAAEAIRLNVTECDVPHYKVETLEYRRGNDKVKFAGLPEFNDGSIVVDDVVGLDTKSKLMAWLRLAYDPHTFKGGRMKDYKKTCTLLEYTQDYELIRTWTLYGCFVTEVSEGKFNRENDEKRQLTATIVYDRAIMNTPEEELAE